jgi:hypothetical protein
MHLVLNVLNHCGLDYVNLLLEPSFKRREPFDSRFVHDIKASVEY